MTLKDTLQTDLITALKAKDELAVATLRSAIGAYKSAEKAGKTAVEFTDEQVEATLVKQRKQRLESAEIFTQADEPARAARELAEAEVLERYITPAPPQLSEEELAAVVVAELDAFRTEVGEVTGKQRGQLIQRVIAAVAGAAEKRAVAEAVGKHF